MTTGFTNLRKFNKDLAKFSKAIEVDVGVVVKKTALEVYKGVTEKTPVDTGYARASWNIGARIDPSVEKRRDFLTSNQARARAINLSKAAAVSAGKPEEIYYITNNVPYIEYLERGSSKQSRHMVIRTLNEVAANIKALLGGIGK